MAINNGSMSTVLPDGTLATFGSVNKPTPTLSISTDADNQLTSGTDGLLYVGKDNTKANQSDVLTYEEIQASGADLDGKIASAEAIKKVASQGGGSGEVYSEEETVVGNVDGKPLYCKKIILNLPKGAYSSQLVFDGGAQNIKEILSHTFNLHNQWVSSTSYRFVTTKYNNKGNIYASVGSEHPALTLDGYIKYTKTTD